MLPVVPGREVHDESELAIVVGRGGRDIPRERWADHVFGYACLLDMVVRGREERVFRKAFDTFCPVGPWITTADEVGDPTDIGMRLWVNDELRQDANTRDLVLDIPGMIEMASAVMTLHPGDIIATGTPAGDALRRRRRDMGGLFLIRLRICSVAPWVGQDTSAGQSEKSHPSQGQGPARPHPPAHLPRPRPG